MKTESDPAVVIAYLLAAHLAAITVAVAAALWRFAPFGAGLRVW